jgi:hypothetical protein
VKTIRDSGLKLYARKLHLKTQQIDFIFWPLLPIHERLELNSRLKHRLFRPLPCRDPLRLQSNGPTGRPDYEVDKRTPCSGSPKEVTERCLGIGTQSTFHFYAPIHSHNFRIFYAHIFSCNIVCQSSQEFFWGVTFYIEVLIKRISRVVFLSDVPFICNCVRSEVK